MRSLWIAALALALGFASPATAATFEAVDAPAFVQSITINPPTAPFLPPNFGTMDITFANGTERIGVPLEAEFLLLDDHLPAFLPACGCDGFDSQIAEPSASGNFSLGYYFTHSLPGSPGVMMDGLLLRLRENNLCVHAIRRTTWPIDVVTVFPNPDCLVMRAERRIPWDFRRWAELLRKVEFAREGDRPIRWPEPVCLTCPPWETYLTDRSRFETIHQDNVTKELTRVVELGQKLLKERRAKR